MSYRCEWCDLEWRTFVGYFFHWALFGKRVR